MRAREMILAGAVLLAVGVVSVVSSASAAVISFDFSSLPGATVKFTGTGDKIEFPSTDPAGYDFAITDATSPALGGLKGNIGGTFTVGPIGTPFPNMEQAAVMTTSGLFSIDDGAGYMLTADLDLKDIKVFTKLWGGMNTIGIANLTNSVYSGSNSDLLGIAAASDGTVVLSFQFSSGTKKSLTELMVDGKVNSTSYSGSGSATPEPATLGLLAFGAVVLFRRRRAA